MLLEEKNMKIKALPLFVAGFLIISFFASFTYATPQQESYFIKNVQQIL